MNELSYSVDAKNTLHKFYNVDRIVYVEGDEDILFWGVVLKKFCPKTDYELIAIGGKPKLKPYIDEIESGKGQFLVALDSDFDFIERASKHPQIIRTFGYSIENTILCPASISKTLLYIGQLNNNQASVIDCERWLSELEVCTKKLLSYDIENERSGKGNVVLGVNFDRISVSKNSSKVCLTKVEEIITNISFEVDSDQHSAILELIQLNDLTVLDLLKGHFLFSAASRYIGTTIRQHKKSVSIPNDILFATLLMAFESSFDAEHKHFEHYRKELS